MGITRRAALFSCALTAATLVAGPAFGQSVEEFYRGKALTLIVSADAGTPTDTFARQFARFFAKHIPGQPIPVVQNVIGAGGMVAAASLQTSQPKDGTVVGFLQRNNLYTPLLEPKQSNFDPRKVTWLGSLDKVNYALVAMTRTGVTTADDLFKEELIIGATGFSNENRILPAMLNQYVGTKMKIVPGYTGRSEVYLAMQRGEVDGWASTIDGVQEGEPARMLADGEMKVLLHLAWKSDPAFSDVPNLSAYVTDPDVKALFDFFVSPFEAGRPIALPQGVPQDRLDALRAAFSATIADPEFIAAVEGAGFPVNAIDAVAMERIINKIYDAPVSVIEEARKFRNL
ncbi:Bug family tripartite tricarboxylate transporter substrate binding protein [Phytopseudomonas daroniae]|uniref:Bug family tripartite tricarboxylate transporter substrate binding protein n=1 Tax=Phytopseudomonas daroniae TaxID=2487519 RepID=UPI001ABEF804|nr:tripartite tricarboxylate transporter substrate-binding protein [Pseudomonas daroniae]